MPNITTRQLITPPQVLPWANVYSQVRSAINTYSAAEMEDSQIVQAVDRAVDSVWPKYFVHEQWGIQLQGSIPVSVTLPFAVEEVITAQWAPVDQSAPGNTIPPTLWEIDGTVWKWLGSQDDWPQYMFYLAFDVLFRCQNSTINPTVCTVPMQYLLPLAKAELLPILGMNGGMPLADAIKQAEQIKQQTKLTMAALRKPTAPPKWKQGNVNTIFFMTWGATSIGFNDFL